MRSSAVPQAIGVSSAFLRPDDQIHRTGFDADARALGVHERQEQAPERAEVAVAILGRDPRGECAPEAARGVRAETTAPPSRSLPASPRRPRLHPADRAGAPACGSESP